MAPAIDYKDYLIYNHPTTKCIKNCQNQCIVSNPDYFNVLKQLFFPVLSGQIPSTNVQNIVSPTCNMLIVERWISFFVVFCWILPSSHVE